MRGRLPGQNTRSDDLHHHLLHSVACQVPVSIRKQLRLVLAAPGDTRTGGRHKGSVNDRTKLHGIFTGAGHSEGQK